MSRVLWAIELPAAPPTSLSHISHPPLFSKNMDRGKLAAAQQELMCPNWDTFVAILPIATELIAGAAREERAREPVKSRSLVGRKAASVGMTVSGNSERGPVSVRSKPAPFAEKKNAKSAAPAKAEPGLRRAETYPRE